MKPFRFGTFPYPFEITSGKKWIKQANQLEKLGYSTLMYSDHFPKKRSDPLSALASAAVTTKKLNVGTLVLDVDFRHPAVLAKAAATLHILTNGRFEFGIGAGWDKKDYDMTGIPFDIPSVRIQRLDEALKIIKSMWTNEKTSFKGKFYSLNNMEMAGELPNGQYPKILVGGGGKKLLTVAGRHPDIVGIHVKMNDTSEKGYVDAQRNMTLNNIKKRISWVKDSAQAEGRNPDNIEFQLLCPIVEITDDPKASLRNLAKMYLGKISLMELYESPRVLVGTASNIREKLVWLREETGINYIIIFPHTPELHKVFSLSVIKQLRN
jgi:probable F420-dependent oxidoreductase